MAGPQMVVRGQVPGPLPEAGGVMDQPACVLAALDLMDFYLAALTDKGD